MKMPVLPHRSIFVDSIQMSEYASPPPVSVPPKLIALLQQFTTSKSRSLTFCTLSPKLIPCPAVVLFVQLPSIWMFSIVMFTASSSTVITSLLSSALFRFRIVCPTPIPTIRRSSLAAGIEIASVRAIVALGSSTVLPFDEAATIAALIPATSSVAGTSNPRLSPGSKADRPIPWLFVSPPPRK